MIFKNKIPYIIVSVLAFLWSYFLLGYYVNGDQYYYHQFYDAAGDVGLARAIFLGSTMLSAGEPVSLSVLWLGAKLGVPKNVYVSVLNVIFFLGIFSLCRKNKCPWYSFLLLVFGYYVIVLMTGAERLKIGYVFAVWSLLLSGFFRYVFAFLSVLSHFQMTAFMAIIYFKLFLSGCFSIFRTARVSKFFLISILILMIIVVPTLALLAGKVLAKVSGYYGDELKFIDITNIIFLFGVSFLVFRRWDFRVWGVLLFLPFVLVLGGSRVNIMAVSFALYFFVICRKMADPFVLILLIYFVAKSYFFMSSIFVYGHGFG